MPVLETYHGYPLWQYIPSLPAAVLFAILFGFMTLLHAYTTYRYRMWFCIPFIVGGCCEVVGYIGRALAYDETGQLGPYIMQSVLLLIAPIFFAASLYMTLGRLIRTVRGDPYSILPARWITRIFVFGDCFSFLVQASGAGILVKGGQSTGTGQNIIVAGLIFQIVMFGFFCLTTVLFHIRFRNHQSTNTPNICWQRTLRMLYLTSAGIVVRNIFRTVEYAEGPAGYGLTHEWYIYVFDGLLMFIVMGCFWWYWPEASTGESAGTARKDIALRSREQDDRTV